MFYPKVFLLDDHGPEYWPQAVRRGAQTSTGGLSLVNPLDVELLLLQPFCAALRKPVTSSDILRHGKGISCGRALSSRLNSPLRLTACGPLTPYEFICHPLRHPQHPRSSRIGRRSTQIHPSTPRSRKTDTESKRGESWWRWRCYSSHVKF